MFNTSLKLTTILSPSVTVGFTLTPFIKETMLVFVLAGTSNDVMVIVPVLSLRIVCCSITGIL